MKKSLKPSKINEELLDRLNESVCAEADHLVSNEKREEYGAPKHSMTQIADLWSAILGTSISARDVALCMIALKIAREKHAHKRDNLTDICGYAKLIELVEQ